MPGCVPKIERLLPTLEDALRSKKELLESLVKCDIAPDSVFLSTRKNIDELRMLLCLTSNTDELVIGEKVANHIANWIATRCGSRTANTLDSAIWSAIGLPRLANNIETIDATGLTPSDCTQPGDTSRHIRPPHV